MKLGNFKRINTTDYPEEDKNLVEQLGRQLNDGIDQLYFAVGGKLTFDDNFSATVRDVEITVGTTGIPVNKTSLTLNNSNVVTGTLVISAVNKTNAASFPTTSPFISFTQNGTSLFIDNITGLQANNRYIIRLIALN